MNLLVARNTPSLADLDIARYQKLAEQWADDVRRRLPGAERVFRRTPQDWKNDVIFFRLGVPCGYLEHEAGIAYNEDQRTATSVYYTDPSDLFLAHVPRSVPGPLRRVRRGVQWEETVGPRGGSAMDFPIVDLLDQAACYEALVRWLHPGGLACPRCQARDRLTVHRRGRDPVLDYRGRGCGRVFNAFTGTAFHGTHRRPAQLVVLLRGVVRGDPTARLARELGASRPHLLELRHRLQDNARCAAERAPLPDARVEADEWGAYKGVPARGRPHASVHHGGARRGDRREWARDDDGNGIWEVHCNTLEGIGTGLRTYLRPFRGVSKWHLAGYLAVFQWNYNLKDPDPALPRALLGGLNTDLGT